MSHSQTVAMNGMKLFLRDAACMKQVELVCEEDIQVDVKFNVLPGDPGIHTYSNGDPGYPPTPDDIEIIEVRAAQEIELFGHDDSTCLTINKGSDISDMLTPEDYDRLKENVELPQADDCDEPDDIA
jgi:hypothetical protein